MKRAKSENDGGDENLRQPYLSGAYIRSFVKQLTSSRSMREKMTTTIVEREREREEPQQHPQQHKKQVRRRLQTRKPYQEKLLNMAEARREIVTALKLHRAAMKQATDQQQQQQQQQQQIESTDHKSRRNSRIYASNNFADNNNVIYSPCYYSCPVIPSAPPPAFFQENVDFALPSQALGLNLNLQDFITAPSSIYSSSSPSTSSSPPPPPPPPIVERVEFLNCVEMIKGEEEREEEMVSSPFDEVREIPAWLNANESCLQHVDEFCAQDFFQNPVLPCMDIEEIEGMDGEWLA